MIALTPALASKMLDRLGPPRHFVPLNESPSTPDLLRMLRARLSSRVKWVAIQSGLSEETVRRVLRSLLAGKPSEPEALEREGDSNWLQK